MPNWFAIELISLYILVIQKIDQFNSEDIMTFSEVYDYEMANKGVTLVELFNFCSFE